MADPLAICRDEWPALRWRRVNPVRIVGESALLWVVVYRRAGIVRTFGHTKPPHTLSPAYSSDPRNDARWTTRRRPGLRYAIRAVRADLNALEAP